MTSLPRILMLHGYTQSAAIFRSKTAAVRKQCKEFEFVYVDAPLVMNLPTESADDREGFDSAVNTDDDPELAPRAWYTADQRPDGTKEYRGCEESFKFLIDLLQREQFVGILGFSQGAAMAGLLMAYLQNPSAHPLFESATKEKPLHGFEFAVLVAGFTSVDPVHAAAYHQKIQGRCLHVLGRGDGIVAEDRTLPFLTRFENPRVEWHDGGHHVPAKTAWRKFFQSYFNARGDDSVPSPSGSNSGASTPRL